MTGRSLDGTYWSSLIEQLSKEINEGLFKKGYGTCTTFNNIERGVYVEFGLLVKEEDLVKLKIKDENNTKVVEGTEDDIILEANSKFSEVKLKVKNDNFSINTKYLAYVLDDTKNEVALELMYEVVIHTHKEGIIEDIKQALNIV